MQYIPSFSIKISISTIMWSSNLPSCAVYSTHKRVTRVHFTHLNISEVFSRGWAWFHTFCVFCPHRATIEEVEGDVCELESKLDKVSTTHEKHCLIVRFRHRVSQQLQRPSCNGALVLTNVPWYFEQDWTKADEQTHSLHCQQRDGLFVPDWITYLYLCQETFYCV